jgi:A/G-specific adenine glycosylase
MIRHGLGLKAEWRQARVRYHVKRWPLFAPAQYGRLMDWYRNNGRELPWRSPQATPWAVLLAEMLLRQTSARHVAKVWTQLVEAYPTPAALLAAPAAELHGRVLPLGMGSIRTKALRAMAQTLVERHGGEIPSDYEELISLPHVGPYTANAVRCFGYGLAAPVVDVNFLRFFQRYFGVEARTRNPHRQTRPWRLAHRLMPSKDMATYQWAILDLASLVCTTKNPKCSDCPIRSGCQSFIRRESNSDHINSVK